VPTDGAGDPQAFCKRCAATSLRSQTDVVRELSSIKRELDALGIRTSTPVRVQLASSGRLRAAAGEHALGATVTRGSQVVELLVLRDLPLVKFGSTVAHEVMHAYLAQQGFGRLPGPVAEGLCQLLAYAWVIRRPGPVATAERRSIEENPHPVYGDGFRHARDAVRRVGVSRTLATVKQSHRFP
jgi:hypothetical protein